MITHYIDKKNCCGCTACYNACPQQAIAMLPDKEGFLYPVIDADLCIECRLCITVCPILTELNNGAENMRQQPEPIVYAFKHKDDKVRMASSSGGAYTAISDFVLKKNPASDGAVSRSTLAVCYGAEFSADFTVRHQGAATTEIRNHFRGSKYVQSDLELVYTEIKQNLIEGKTVLFTGAPCQIAGLRSYLIACRIDQANLILNDIICHGTPSPLLWKQYIAFLETQYNSKLKSYHFRSKAEGWQGYPVRIELENGLIKINTAEARIFMKLYFSHLILRPACYYCKFANTARPSDITIGDFWGIEELMPDFADDKGISLVIVNTRKGQAIIEQIKDEMYYKPSNLIDCSKYQHNLNQPVGQPFNRDQFWQDYYQFGFVYIVQKYAEDNFFRKLKAVVRKYLKKVLSRGRGW